MWISLHAQGNNQLDGAFDYLKKVGGTAIDTKALDEASGVGVVVSFVCVVCWA